MNVCDQSENQGALLGAARRLAETAYGLSQPLYINPLAGGRINQSFYVRTGQGEFVLQRLHAMFGLDGAVVINAAAAAESMASAGLNAPLTVKTTYGQLWVDHEGLWRLSRLVPGRRMTACAEKGCAEAVGYLGKFHRAMKEHPPQLAPVPAGDFVLPEPLRPSAWDTLLNNYRSAPEYASVRDSLIRGRAMAAEIEKFEMTTVGVIHGDPKLDNFLFDESGRAVGLVDLDTVHIGSIVWELADALRSMACIREPGDHVRLNATVFRSVVEAYRAKGLPLTDQEWQALPSAMAGRALNLAWRYLKDVFEQSGFAWDRGNYPSHREQNLSRGNGMLLLAAEVLANQRELRA